MTRFACAFLLAACLGFAQLPPAQAPTPVLSAPHAPNLRLLEVEAIAADPTGRIAPDLTAADFTIAGLNDNSVRKVKIVDCAYIDTRERRTLALVLDDLALTADAVLQVRSAIQRFVAATLNPADRLAILRTGSGEGALQPLTGDKEILARAIARIEYNPRSALYSGGAARTRAFASGTLGILRVAIEGLRQLTGRKSVVLISPHLADQPVADLDALASAARRAEVSLYGIDPAGELATPVDRPPPSAGATPVEFTNFAIARLDTASGIPALAKRTAGVLAVADNAVDQALARILSGPDGYYRVAFQAPDLSDLAHLELTRPGYELLTTRQVTAGSRDPQGLTPSRRAEDDLSRAIVNPFFTGEIPVRLTTIFSHTTDGDIVETLVHFDMHNLALRQTLDGVYHGHVDALAAAFGTTVQSVAHAAQGVDLVWSQDQYQRAQVTGITIPLQMTVPTAALQIRVLVRDGASGRMGSAHRWLDVPSLKEGHLAVSSVLLEGPEEKDAPKDSEATPDVRIFRLSQPITYRFDLYNLATDNQKASRVELQLTFFRPNGSVAVQPPLSLEFAATAVGARQAVGKITFPPNAEAGRYQLQVTVTDLLAPAGGPRTAMQFVEFELRP
jgi:VWFA-related protein